MANPGPSSAIDRNEENLPISPPVNEDESESQGISPFNNSPEGVLFKIFGKLSVSDLKNCRLTCQKWNYVILLFELLDMKSCFLFDGRRDDVVGNRCAEYMDNSPTKNYYWSHFKFRRVSGRQTPWLLHHLEHDPDVTNTITKLELLNCSVNWTAILQFLLYLPNLYTFIDRQDMYCWDYQTFNSGIDEDENISSSAPFLELRNRNKIDNLGSIRVIRIHRSQLVECTTYLKIFMLSCSKVRELEVTTDQNFAPQRATSFYSQLYNFLNKNKDSLKTLVFPYKVICPTYDFRVMDEHHCFREFVNYITDRGWVETLQMKALENLHMQFGIIPVDNQDLKTKIVPFIKSIPTLRNFTMGCVLLESGMERFLEEFLKETESCPFRSKFGVYMNDAAGIPSVLNFQGHLQSLSVQTFRDMAKQLKNLVPMFGMEFYNDIREFQYFSKNHSFRNFNFELLVESFANLTRLNLVDHNSRLETRHSCEALATIEDEEMQLIVTKLEKLESLQLITNMTYLTDSGLTGINLEACKEMHRENVFILQEDDKMFGKPLSNLKSLRYLVMRGLGIKVTDVTAHFAFNDMGLLRKLHIYGCHQLTANARSVLSQKFNATNGCDLQVGSS